MLLSTLNPFTRNPRSARSALTALLGTADIVIGGTRAWDIQVNDERFYSTALYKGSLGQGESYMQGWWDCAALDQMVYRGLTAELDRNITFTANDLVRLFAARLINRQTFLRSHKVIKKHYDIDPSFFMTFLDPYNQYTCGYFKDTHDLVRAQEQKLDLICQKLELSSKDHVLDIGCGWGGFAKYAASKYGCQVTGISISDQQIAYAQDYCSGLPVTIKKCDYRHLTGRFDKVLVCGMLEHVGFKNYRQIFEIVRSVLDPAGIFLLHTIGSNVQQVRGNPWLNKYIFPNYIIPSLTTLAPALEGLFVMEDWHNFGPYYDDTLLAWNANFERTWPTLKDKYPESFRRMWNFYFLSCAAHFRARRSQLWQIVLTPTGRAQPKSRLS